MGTIVEVTALAAIVLGITEFIKSRVQVNGFWLALGVSVVIAAIGFFVPNYMAFLTVLMALFTEVFGYQVLKNVGVLGKKKVGGGGGSFRPRS